MGCSIVQVIGVLQPTRPPHFVRVLHDEVDQSLARPEHVERRWCDIVTCAVGAGQLVRSRKATAPHLSKSCSLWQDMTYVH